MLLFEIIFPLNRVYIDRSSCCLLRSIHVIGDWLIEEKSPRFYSMKPRNRACSRTRAESGGDVVKLWWWSEYYKAKPTGIDSSSNETHAWTPTSIVFPPAPRTLLRFGWGDPIYTATGRALILWKSVTNGAFEKWNYLVAWTGFYSQVKTKRNQLIYISTCICNTYLNFYAKSNCVWGL